MSRVLFGLSLAALAVLAGCATVPAPQRAAACANTDWHRYGVNDGVLGVPASERASRFADCAELGQPVDVAAYQRGRAEGLREYCTAEKGYEVGSEGRRYQNVCPPELAADFLQGYAEGRKDRPNYAVYPGLGIGIGSGGVRTGIGIGIGIGGMHDPYDRYRRYGRRDGLWNRRPFGCGVFWPIDCW